MKDRRKFPLDKDSLIALFTGRGSKGPDTPEERRKLWRRSMNFILVSLALGFINLRFNNLLDLLLPSAGFAFGLLGWYPLRRENRGFRLGWILILVRTGLFFLDTFRSFTLLGLNDLLSEPLIRVTGIVFILLHALQLYALKTGIGLLQKKAGRQEDTWIITVMILWDVVLAVLSGWAGGLLVIALFAVLAALLYQLYRLMRSLGGIGDTLSPAPPGLRPAALICLYLGALFIGCVLCFLCFSRYPMKWSKHESPVTFASSPGIGAPGVPSQTEVIARQLKDLGFPEELLTDLSEEDLQKCDGALDVYTNDGSFRASDTFELRVRSVAVVLSEEPRVWRIFYCFSLPDQKKYRGTDALEIRPAALYSFVPEITQTPEGRLLREKNGKTLAAPITRIRKEFCGTQSDESPSDAWSGEAWFASFSLPRRYQNARGYVTLEVRNIYPDVDFSLGSSTESLIRSRWSNGLLYLHQIRALQYPVLSAKNYAIQHTASSVRGPFLHVGLESWFFPGKD